MVFTFGEAIPLLAAKLSPSVNIGAGRRRASYAVDRAAIPVIIGLLACEHYRAAGPSWTLMRAARFVVMSVLVSSAGSLLS